MCARARVGVCVCMPVCECACVRARARPLHQRGSRAASCKPTVTLRLYGYSATSRLPLLSHLLHAPRSPTATSFSPHEVFFEKYLFTAAQNITACLQRRCQPLRIHLPRIKRAKTDKIVSGKAVPLTLAYTLQMTAMIGCTSTARPDRSR